jgi:hypothetical protein
LLGCGRCVCSISHDRDKLCTMAASAPHPSPQQVHTATPLTQNCHWSAFSAFARRVGVKCQSLCSAFSFPWLLWN